jgi:hypothetical protein
MGERRDKGENTETMMKEEENETGTIHNDDDDEGGKTERSGGWRALALSGACLLCVFAIS